MRIAWRTVGAITTRVWDDVETLHDRFADLTRLGIDETSYQRGHRYLTVVVDHDSGRLVWAAPGRDKATLEAFFDALEASRRGPLRGDHPRVGRWGGLDQRRRRGSVPQRGPVRRLLPHRLLGHRRPRRGPPAGVERGPWRGPPAPRTRATGHAKQLKGARYALWKNPENLTTRQQAKLAWVATTDPRLHRAYLLKEGLRLVFQLSYHHEAIDALEAWIGWARRCRIPAFVALQKRIVKHKASILAAIEHGLSNGRIESVNTKIRLITRIGFGFRSPEALIALAMLNPGGHKPALPGRS